MCAREISWWRALPAPPSSSGPAIAHRRATINPLFAAFDRCGLPFGYSDVGKGFWPFGVSKGPSIRARYLVMERHPKLEYLTTGTPEAANNWCPESSPRPLDVRHRGGGSKIRRRRRSPCRVLHPAQCAGQAGVAPAGWTYRSRRDVSCARTLHARFREAVRYGESATVEIADRTFTAPGDCRELGVV